MAILRKRKQSNFTTISNIGLKDDKLSFKAKGLLIYMWSLPDDWNFYETEIAKHSIDGIASVRSGLKELEECGYLIKQRVRKSNGQLGPNDWLICDEPTLEKPDLENPSLEKPSLDNRTLLNTNLNNNLKEPITNNNIPIDMEKAFSEVWDLYPKKATRKEAVAAFKSAVKSGTDVETIKLGVQNYVAYLEENKSWLEPMDGGRWFKKERWSDEYNVKAKVANQYEKDLGF